MQEITLSGALKATAKASIAQIFYGGVLVKSDDLKEVQSRLKAVCNNHHFYNTEHYLDKYGRHEELNISINTVKSQN